MRTTPALLRAFVFGCEWISFWPLMRRAWRDEVHPKKQTTGSLMRTLSYGYDGYGRLSTRTYPSGRVLAYSYNANGQVAGIQVNGADLVTHIAYHPLNHRRRLLCHSPSASIMPND